MSLRGTKQSHAIQGRSAQFAIASYLAMTILLTLMPSRYKLKFVPVC